MLLLTFGCKCSVSLPRGTMGCLYCDIVTFLIILTCIFSNLVSFCNYGRLFLFNLEDTLLVAWLILPIVTDKREIGMDQMWN